jgi:hypothetical protein
MTAEQREQKRERDRCYNASPKGRARHARYREKNREAIREKSQLGGMYWGTRRRRELGKQRTQVLEQLAALQQGAA